MSDYWLSTKSPRIFKQSYETAERDAYLIENQGIDSALLAADLNMQSCHVVAYQRKLGLRAFQRSPDAQQRWGKKRK